MHVTAIPANDFTPNENQPSAFAARDALHEIVSGAAGDFYQKIDALRSTLDRIEREYLQNAARANDHVEVCEQLHNEVVHMQRVITQIHERMGG